MKRFLVLFLAALMICCAFVACNNDEGAGDETTTAAKTEAPTTEEPTTEEPTTEEPTTENTQPKQVEYYVDCWEDRGARAAEKITESHKGLGFLFTITEGYISEVSVPAPSYSDSIGTLSMKIFAWDTDYDTTVAKEPLQVDTFVDFPDNERITSYYEEGKIGPGTYMVLVCDPVDDSGSGVGLWTNGVIRNDEFLLEDAEKYQIQSIANGKISKKKIAEFSFTHVYEK